MTQGATTREVPDTAATPALSDRFKLVMAHYPAAVTVITTGRGNDRRGLTATAVSSLSTEPARLLVCVNRNADAHDFFVRHGSFCVNLLDVTQVEVAKRFSAADGSRGAMRFARGEWEELASGAPALADGLSSIDCRVFRMIEADTHTIILGDVLDVRLRSDRLPLLYFKREFCRLDLPARPERTYAPGF